jgi:pimeloyl-ACP methyl ester carboxylesterase
MKHLPILQSTALFLSALLLPGCANFRKLGKDLKLIDSEYRVSGIIGNRDSFTCPVRALVIEWDQPANKVYSGDLVDLTAGGAFMFIVKSPLNQHVAAYADTNKDGKHNPGEPLWIHRDRAGNPSAVTLSDNERVARVTGNLSTSEKSPPALAGAVADMLKGRKLEDVITHQGVKFALGETVDLDDPRFAATRGEDGLWTPATFAIQSGFGLYFVNRYDPAKTPVLFIHGAAGSPQDWRHAMEKIDDEIYQPWFYVYPSGMRLEQAANALNEGVKQLHGRYGFKRLHVVAHSMGGLVAREFVIRNAITGKNSYINTLITFSSPWDGHEAAAMGVKYAPKVVPSWRDMSHGSDFLTHLYDQKLKGRVNHHLFFSHHATKSRILPPENDGTVSVASQKRSEAVADAVEVKGFDEDHVSILSSRAALSAGKKILDAATP